MSRRGRSLEQSVSLQTPGHWTVPSSRGLPAFIVKYSVSVFCVGLLICFFSLGHTNVMLVPEHTKKVAIAEWFNELGCC